MKIPEPSEVPDSFEPVWYYQNAPVKEIPEDCICFVYCITNTKTGRKYFGKKTCQFKKTKQKTVTLKNGTKKKKKVTEYVLSDYETYFGSNKEIHKEIEEFGSEIFFREILVWCKTQAESSYIEAKYQFHYDVLLDSQKYYNSYIMVRSAPSHVKNLQKVVD